MEKVTQMGLDCHKKFSTVTARDATGRIAFRTRLEHADRGRMRAQIRDWPRGVPVVLEGTFGWGWMCDELSACGVEPHLTSGSKTKAWRQARGKAKSNRLDADLLAELWSQQPRWWEVWLAPPEVRQQREWMRHRMGLVQMQTQVKNRMQATPHRHGILAPLQRPVRQGRPRVPRRVGGRERRHVARERPPRLARQSATAGTVAPAAGAIDARSAAAGAGQSGGANLGQTAGDRRPAPVPPRRGSGELQPLGAALPGQRGGRPRRGAAEPARGPHGPADAQVGVHPGGAQRHP